MSVTDPTLLLDFPSTYHFSVVPPEQGEVARFRAINPEGIDEGSVVLYDSGAWHPDGSPGLVAEIARFLMWALIEKGTSPPQLETLMQAFLPYDHPFRPHLGEAWPFVTIETNQFQAIHSNDNLIGTYGSVEEAIKAIYLEMAGEFY